MSENENVPYKPNVNVLRWIRWWYVLWYGRNFSWENSHSNVSSCSFVANFDMFLIAEIIYSWWWCGEKLAHEQHLICLSKKNFFSSWTHVSVQMRSRTNVSQDSIVNHHKLWFVPINLSQSFNRANIIIGLGVWPRKSYQPPFNKCFAARSVEIPARENLTIKIIVYE